VSANVGDRPGLLSAVRVEWLTVGWMAIVAIVAGLLARSLLVTAFGLESVIKLITRSVLLWRLNVEARGAAAVGGGGSAGGC
jgi:hypothetical protein